MLNLPNFLKSFNLKQWPQAIALKSFDETIGQLFVFFAELKKQTVRQRSYKEALESIKTHRDTCSIFEETFIWVIQSPPTKPHHDDWLALRKAIDFGDSIVFVANHPFQAADFEIAQKIQFYSCDKALWQEVINLMRRSHPHPDIISWPDYPQVCVSVEQAIELWRYSWYGLDTELLIHSPTNVSQGSWLIFEQYCYLASAQHLAYKQLFVILNQLETIYLWSLAPTGKKNNFYLPLSVKSFLQKVPAIKLQELRQFYLLALEAMVSFDESTARFHLTVWIKKLTKKFASNR